jgi:truncated hemoglobin YjbI
MRLSLLLSLVLLSLTCQKTKPKPPPTSLPTPQACQGAACFPPTKAREPVTLKILSPREGDVLSAKAPAPVTVKFELENYELQPDGQHLHIVIDNNPYESYYDLSEPFVSKALLSPGTHTIRAFPVGGPLTDGVVAHEAIKDPNAFASVTFVVGKANGKFATKPGEPILTLSRPSGEYTGEEARRLLLDFWIKNAELGEGKYSVKYSIDKEKIRTLSSWEKSFISGLAVGDHTIDMWLVGPDGNEVAGAFTRSTQQFTLKEVAPKTLYERVGGRANIEVVVQDLLLSLANNEELKKDFAKVDLVALKGDLCEQLCEKSGGPCQYTGEPLKDAHPKMKLSKKEFELLRQELTKTLTKNQIREREKKELEALFAAMQLQFVAK